MTMESSHQCRNWQSQDILVDREHDQAKVCSVLQLDLLARSKRTQPATQRAPSSTEEGDGDDDDSLRHRCRLGKFSRRTNGPLSVFAAFGCSRSTSTMSYLHRTMSRDVPSSSTSRPGLRARATEGSAIGLLRPCATAARRRGAAAKSFVIFLTLMSGVRRPASSCLE